MSLYDYKKSLEISTDDPPFAALIMAAIRKADSKNLMKLKSVFPKIYMEFKRRYDAPGGILKDDINSNERLTFISKKQKDQGFVLD